MVNKCATKKSNKPLFLVSCKPQMWKIWSPYNYRNTQHPYKIELSTTYVQHQKKISFTCTTTFSKLWA